MKSGEQKPERTALQRWCRALLISLPLGYLGFSLFVGVGFTSLQMVRRYQKKQLALPKDLSGRATRIEFQSTQGLMIRGVYSPPLGEAPILILQHGKGDTRDAVMPWAHSFAKAGFGVLCFDWRGHGKSDGKWIEHGAGEPDDLVAAVAWLQNEPSSKNRPIGILGFSLGAACIANTGARLPKIVKCLVLDSPYGDLGRMVDTRLSKLGPASVGPEMVLDAIAKLAIGQSVSTIQPERKLQGFAPRPIFSIHGDNDLVVPLSEGKSLYEKYSGEKEFWETKGTHHCGTNVLRTREWMRRVTEFFGKHLKGSPGVEDVLKHTPEKLERGKHVYAKNEPKKV